MNSASINRRTWPALLCRALSAACLLLAGIPAHAQNQDSSVLPRGNEWSTRGNQIVDASGSPVRLTGVNWYGFETTTYVVHGLWAQDYKYILNAIKSNGYNVIRIPFSNQMVETNPVPNSISFSNSSGPINTDLQGLTALQVLDKVVCYAGSIGLRIILDNHRSEAGNSAEASGLWYTDAYPEAAWLNDWITLTTRYKDSPAVIGMDLRNEPHNAYAGGSCWTGDTNANIDVPGCPLSDTAHNWPGAAQRAGDIVLGINPHLLVFVEGVDEYDNDYYWNGGNLEGVADYPVALGQPSKLVYSAHDYGPNLYQQPWFNSSTTPATLDALWDKHWGYIYNDKIAPVWVGEFGTDNTPSDIVSTTPGSQGQWFGSLVHYISRHAWMNWTYWALNGEDEYALLDSNYDKIPVSPTKQALLSSIQFR
jgi:endoglucanase